MATQLTEKATHYLVSIVSGKGRRRRIPRDTVSVPKGDLDALRAVLVASAELARKQEGFDAE